MTKHERIEAAIRRKAAVFRHLGIRHSLDIRYIQAFDIPNPEGQTTAVMRFDASGIGWPGGRPGARFERNTSQAAEDP